jgi:flagellar hook protein FlgE
MMPALTSAISGLQNNTTWMNVIGDNIANVSTVGYKETRITFKEAISQSMGAASGSDTANSTGGINPEQLGLGVTLGSLDTIMTQGAIQTTGNATDVAIQGNGFFVLKSGNTTSYTRAGNFYFDNNGNLVNSSGELVQGWMRQYTKTAAPAAPLVTVADTLSTNGPVSNIVIPQNMVLAPKATGDMNLQVNAKIQTGIDLSGNLDSMTPQNTVGGAAYAGPAAGYPAAGYTPDATTSATVYDSLGNAHVIVFEWTQTNATPANGALWNWSAYDTGSKGQLPIPTGAPVVGDAVNVGNGTGVAFNSDGSLATSGAWANATAGATIPQIQLVVANADGSFTPQTISVFMGTDNAQSASGIGARDGLTGDYGNGTINTTTNAYQPKQTIYTSSVDGYSEGTLTGVSIDSNGKINCSFSNNQTIAMGQLALANFSNAEGLNRAGATTFTQSANSGMAEISTAGNAGLGTTQGGALESSNVDLSVELTNMIVAQRGFDANARIVTTSSQMLTTLVGLGQ